MNKAKQLIQETILRWLNSDNSVYRPNLIIPLQILHVPNAIKFLASFKTKFKSYKQPL